MTTGSGFVDRVAFVTGAGGGIGSALARSLARRGARLALLGRRPAPLESLAAELRSSGASTSVHPADVGDRAAVASALDACVATHGRIDVLVNAAGVGRHVAFAKHDLDDVERMLRTNVLGVIYATQLALPRLVETCGAVVNVSSIAGRLGQPGEAVYSASKFAVTGLGEALAIELGRLGVHVLSVYPGLVRTDFVSPQAWAKLPRSVVGGALDPAALAEDIVSALARRRLELTRPRLAAAAYGVRALCPPLFRRILARMRPG